MAGLYNGLRRLCLANRLLEVNFGDVRLGLVSLVESHHFWDNFGSLQPFVCGNSWLVCGELRVQFFVKCASPAWYLKRDVLDVVRVVESDCSADFLYVHIKSLLGEEVKTFLGLGSSVLFDVHQRCLGILVEAVNIDIHLAASSTEQKVVLSIKIDVRNT